MPAPFTDAEYADRLNQTRQRMQQENLDVLVVGDPANVNWLCGYDAWSFYTPQLMVVTHDRGPLWFGREMDAGAAVFSSCLSDEQVIPFPEQLVQHTDKHPADYIGDWMKQNGLNGKRIGYESDVYYFSPKSLHSLQTRLPEADWVDADLLVNWVRVVKSPAELAMMEKAAQLAGIAMQTAYDGIGVGVRQCDLMADVIAAQIKGTSDFGGDMPALHPLVLAGEAASTAHPMWTDAAFEPDQTVAFELGGCRKRYNAGLARTVHLGQSPAKLNAIADAVNEGMQAVLASLHAGVGCADVHAAWQKVLDHHGLEKKSRIGYSIGVGYSPDWGEHTLSFRPGETDTVPENATIHIILGMWMDDWGMEVSETIHVRADDARCLTQFPREVFEIR